MLGSSDSTTCWAKQIGAYTERSEGRNGDWHRRPEWTVWQASGYGSAAGWIMEFFGETFGPEVKLLPGATAAKTAENRAHYAGLSLLSL